MGEKIDVKALFSGERRKKSTKGGRTLVEEYYSDKSRIIYSSSFRRLQQKAQVFSLESNSSIRTRLTHSLEVADIGRTLAYEIGKNLKEKNLIDDEQRQLLILVVENICLMHDIGNLPFGHFGEAAVQEWSRNNLEKLYKNSRTDGKSGEKNRR